MESGLSVKCGSAGGANTDPQAPPIGELFAEMKLAVEAIVQSACRPEELVVPKSASAEVQTSE